MYHDGAGNLLYETVRFDPKTFKQRRIDENGTPAWGLNGSARVPYHLPDLRCAIAREDVVIVVEGEKDADNLTKLGYTATTNAGGASWQWTDDFVEHFDARVVVIGDNDDGGRKAAVRNANQLLSVAKDVYLIESLPDAPAKGDVTDLFAAGCTKEQFDGLIAQAQRIGPERGVDLLSDVEAFSARFVRLSKHALLAVALWILHTYVIDAAYYTPYLSITSPQRRCGKRIVWPRGARKSGQSRAV